MKSNKILVINAGSSSLKFQLMDAVSGDVFAKGIAERIGIEGSFLTYKKGDSKQEFLRDFPNHKVVMEFLLELLTSKENGVISSVSEIFAFGHRVVNVGEDYFDSVIITEKVLEDFKKNKDFSPLHVPGAISGIEACLSIAPKIKNVAVFDIGFHKTMPNFVYRYAIKKEDYENLKIRKYGAHGTSHRYVSQVCTNLLGKVEGTKIVTCHLGSGSSMCAVKDGKSFDTSMGFTPLEGLIMGTRSGDIDPSVVGFMCDKKGMEVKDVVNYLNKQCGMFGLCGYSDMRDIENHLDNPDCKLAFNALCYRVTKYIGAYAAAMGGLDAIVFTGGIGENDYMVREKVCENLEFLGVKFNKEINNGLRGKQTELSLPDSKVKVFIIPTDEELIIAKETFNLAK